MSEEQLQLGTGEGAAGAPQAPGEEAPRFEALVSDLEGIVGELERGELPLGEALARFEAGMGLAKQAGALLDAAEQRVTQLIEARDGRVDEGPLDPE
jgi:exodeoxyribonuclease VII small subunit